MMNSFKKKGVVDVKPILKDKDKEDKGLALQLVPEYVDKRSFHQGNVNPNYVCAGALYIPKDIIQIVNSKDTATTKIYMGPVKDGRNVFESDSQSVSIEDPDVRKYVNRILRYFKYDPEEAMATLREASFKIKNRARGVVKRTYSQNTVSKLQAWRAKVQYSEEESEEDMQKESQQIGPKVPIIEEEDKEDIFYDGELEEVNKQSFIQKTFNKIFPSRSTTKMEKPQREISSSDTPYSSEGERSFKKKIKLKKKKKSKSMSHLIINDGNMQVTGLISSVTTDPEEKKENFKKIKILNLNKIISKKIKKLIIMLKTICHKKTNVDNKAANYPTNFIYSDMYFTFQGASVKKKSLECECEQYISRQDELLLSYLTAPRIHNSDTCTVILINNENSNNLKSHNRKRALKKMKKRLQRLGSVELDQYYKASTIFDLMAQNENVLRFKNNQEGFVCSNPCFETYDAIDSRTNARQVSRQSVDFIADTFVNFIDSPNDTKCKVEITGHGYRGKFNVGLDPIIDEVLYNSLQNLKETYENSKYYYETPRIDRRRTHTLSNIADNVCNYLKSKVSGRNSMRDSITQFPSQNVIGRTSIQRGRTYACEEDSPELIYDDMDMKNGRNQHNCKRSCAPLTKISKYFIDNGKCKYQPKCNKGKNVRRAKKKRKINSSGSESFQERQFVRRSKGPFPPVLESSDESFILRETSSTIDESLGMCNRSAVKKQDPFNSREVHKQGCYPGLSYISEKDWKVANEIFKKEREAGISRPVRYMSLNEYESEETNKQTSIDNTIDNKKVLKMQDTMTTTTNGVTTLTQTEIIKAINQSSQCIIPSTSKDGLVRRAEFNVLPMKHNETRRDESSGRLANLSEGTEGHKIICEDITVANKKEFNHELYSHKKVENSQKMGYPQSQCPRECRCYEEDKKHYLDSAISTENHDLPDPKKIHGYNDAVIIHNAELHGQKSWRNCTRGKGQCHCNPTHVKTYAFSKVIPRKTPHTEVTDCTTKNPRRKGIALHKVYSDPINNHYMKPYLRNFPKDDDEMCIKINALKETEREQISIRNKPNLKERIEKQESQTPEEVIVTKTGNAKIRVSLGSCDKSQRQQAFLELMEVLKRKLDSENRLLTFKETNKTATVAVMTSCDNRMRLRTNPCKDFEIVTKKRNSITACHRPCFCNEKRKAIPKRNSLAKVIPTQTSFSESSSSSDKKVVDPKVKTKSASISSQTDDLVTPTSKVEVRETPKEPPKTEQPDVPPPSAQLDILEPKENTEISSQNEDLDDSVSAKSSLSSYKQIKSKTSESRPRIKTGSLFSKSLNEKSYRQASRLRQSGSIIYEKPLKSSPRKFSQKETTRKPRKKKPTRKPSKKESTLKSSKRDSVLTSRGSLFVRRSSPSPVPLRKKDLPQTPPSPVVNQRVWIEDLSLPLKYPSNTVSNVKKEKILKPLKSSASYKFKETSNIYYHSNGTDNSTVNSASKKMPRRRSNNNLSKKNRIFSSVPPNYRNNILSSRENGETSIVYCSPKERKKEKFIVTSVRKQLPKSGMVDNSRDSPSSIISKYSNESIISSDTVRNSSCSLLSYEESPSFADYVKNFQHLSSILPTTSDNSLNISDGNKSNNRRAFSSKPRPVRKSITTVKETKKRNKIWPGNCDSISLQYVTETNEALSIVPDSTKTRKDYVSSGHTSLKPIPSTSRGFSEQKQSSSGSSCSITTVVSGPIVHKKRLATSLQNYIAKTTGALDSLRSNKSPMSLKRKGSSIKSPVVSEKNNFYKSRFKRGNLRPIQPGLNKIKNHLVDEILSSDDMVLSDDSNSNPDRSLLEFHKCPTNTSKSQKPNEQLRNDLDDSEVLIEAKVDTKRCLTETVSLKKHDGKPKKGKKSSSLFDWNINSTLCINDDQDLISEDVESEDTNSTNISYDCSTVSLKKSNIKVSKCYIFRATNPTVCSSTGCIVKSSDSDLEAGESNSQCNHKQSKTIGRNTKKIDAKYLTVTTDLRQSSSELLVKRRSPRRTLVHTKSTLKDVEFEPRDKSRKFIHSLLRVKRKSNH